MRAVLPLALLLAVASCHRPPASSYVHGTSIDKPSDQVSLGANAAGEACVQQPAGDRGAQVFCGTWQQPSARIEYGGPGDLAAMDAQSRESAWRANVDARMQCDPPVRTSILGNYPALLFSCASRLGGWPQEALLAAINGSVWRADAVLPAATVMERSIGDLSGVARAGTAPPGSQADGLLARRLAARPFTASDVGAFDELMTAGTRANLADAPSDAEAAFRAAVALQRKILGPNDPNVAPSLLALAVQLSNQSRFAEADQLFAQAAPLVARSADSTARARLLHYRGLHAKNQGRNDEAVALLTQAESEYARWIPADALSETEGPRGTTRITVVSRQDSGSMVRPNPSLLADPRAQVAMIGLIEARRNRALALRALGRPDEAQALLASAETMARANGIDRPMLSARLYRTAGVTASNSGAEGQAIANLARSSGRFQVALPGSKTLAETDLLRAAELDRAGRSGSALSACREAVSIYVSLKSGTSEALMAPCLNAYANQGLLAEMFVAAQVAQGGITAEQIAEASARLREGARDPRVAGAIRVWQDATDKLSGVLGERNAIAQARELGRAPPNGLNEADVEKRIADAQTAANSADSALQAAAPNYGQLVQQVVPAKDIMAALGPREAFVAISLSDRSGWVFVLRRNRIAVAPVQGGGSAVADLVKRIRSSIELSPTGLPKFDTEASRALYDGTLGGVAGALDGATSLTVAPTGPLLSLPFGVLLTGPADPAALAGAPWLARKVAISVVPAPANFLSLRRIAGTSRATRPWFGFGEFRPITLAQASRSFPGSACGESARLLAGLPPLPYTQKELDAARQLVGASPSDELVGSAFTADAVLRLPLKDFRTLQFSTHALLPAEIRCQDQPAIVTSAPPGAASAAGALLTTDKILTMNLDADMVILSACNSGGPGGTTAGESLSGLARAFFYAGARSMLVTHWSVNDQAAAFLVVETLKRSVGDKAKGGAEALREAELDWLDAAAKAPASPAGHPFFWAPFALIGEGHGAGE
jgi:CHAT domain-containing protein